MRELQVIDFTKCEPGQPVLVERVAEICSRCRRVGLRMKSPSLGLVIVHGVVRRKEDQMADSIVRGVLRAALIDYCQHGDEIPDQSKRGD